MSGERQLKANTNTHGQAASGTSLSTPLQPGNGFSFPKLPNLYFHSLNFPSTPLPTCSSSRPKIPTLFPLTDRSTRASFNLDPSILTVSPVSVKPLRKPSVLIHPTNPKGQRHKTVFAISKSGEVGNRLKSHNQDESLIVTDFAGIHGLTLLAVFDGHGPYGHCVSTYLRDHFPAFLQHELAHSRASPPDSYSEAMKNGFTAANVGLRSAGVDYTYSGSTCLAVLLSDSVCVCAHVGDSRAILIRKTRSDWRPTAISVDHRPTLPEEYKRIVACGGTVNPAFTSLGVLHGPARVWLKGQKLPGLAMSRAIGDALATKIGVLAVPTITVTKVSQLEKIVLLASDGLWEVMSNEDAAYTLSRHHESGSDCKQALESLLREAVRRWRRRGEDCDDVTIVGVFFE